MTTKARRILIIVIFAIAASVAGYFWWEQTKPLPVAAPQPELSTAIAIDKEELAPAIIAPAANLPPAIQHPIEAPTQNEQSEKIIDRDQMLAQSLEKLFGHDLWRATFLPEQLITRIVATVDNLPREKASTKMWPVRPAPSWIKTSGNGEEIRLDPANSERYTSYIALVQALPIDKLAGIYRQFYPYFQKTYVDLGYPDGYFNDRLVVTIDDLLATPEPAEAPLLVQKKVRYQFADPDLAGRSAGQKILLRIGVDHARIVKIKLRELRNAVATPTGAKLR